MALAADLQGQIFGKLTCLERVQSGKSGDARWSCQCVCGNVTTVAARDLKQGDTRSCGCIRANLEYTKNPGTHGHTKKDSVSPTYQSWTAMKSRVLNPNTENYQRYGGRGITICDRWVDSFENFLADMGERPDGKTLDRYPDPDGNYEPSNCRWATTTEQAFNKSK